MQLLILGREKKLCLAEAEAVFGKVKIISDDAVIVDSAQAIDINHLGGAIKCAEIITENSTSIESDIANYILKENQGGKINFGISFYGTGKTYKGSGIKIKKSLKSKGLSVRYIQPKSGDNLNAASVIYNKLTKGGFEILIVQKSDKSTLLARTTGIQDINEYSRRDYEKPCRDRKVGMLPPKLSQVMINLAMPEKNSIIVDPFCGSGGLLMEAALMGYQATGSDISQDMIDCSKKNIDWFVSSYSPNPIPVTETSVDATQKTYPDKPYSIVTEGYLGDNFVIKPSASTVQKQLPSLEKLYVNFLKNLQSQSVKPKSVVLCMPFWLVDGTTYQLKIIDEIVNLGYTIHEFQSVKSPDLRYLREGQFTGRQIVVLN